MDKDLDLKKSVLEFKKYLQKQKLKEKPTILDLGQSKMRINIFRTDNLFEIINNHSHIDHISNIFKTSDITIASAKDIEDLLNHLVKNKYLMKLDRAPSKLKTPNYKWPKTMVLNPVSLSVTGIY